MSETKQKTKMTKDIVPEGFTIPMALVDAIPVVFFGASAITISLLFGSILFLIGGILCLIGGVGKVLWKFIVVLKKKNVWPLFVQMRILMPVGFLCMVISLIANHARVSISGIWQSFTQIPSLFLFLVGILGMCLMGIFAKKLDSSDPKANWIEQLTNGVAQIAIFIGLLLLH